MAALDAFSFSEGFFPYTSTIRAALEAQGSAAPHTGKPYTEPMVAGLSGGLAFGLFIFEYKGFDPQVNILTRHTFHNYGWDLLAERLGLVQDVIQSTAPAKAQAKLADTLDAGRVPIVWADVFTLGYEYSDLGEGMWAMQPLVVTAYEPGGEAELFDRSARPIRVSADLLDEARGKVKKEKYKLISIDLPSEPDLAAGVAGGIRDTIALFTEKPPQGSANNFGFKAYDRWVKALSKPNGSGGWLAAFDDSRKRFAAMTSAFRYALTFWEDQTQSADRMLFADFLEEADTAGLPAPGASDALAEAAAAFRRSGASWKKLGEALLPDSIESLAGAREAIVERHEAFVQHGATEAVLELDQSYESMRDESSTTMPDADTLEPVLGAAAEIVSEIRDTEQTAIDALRKAVE